MALLEPLNLRLNNLAEQRMNTDTVFTSSTSQKPLVCSDERLSKLIATEL